MQRFSRLLIVVSFPVLFCAIAVSQQPPLPQKVEKDKSANEPDAAAIAKLIEQLGSPQFTKREEATQALKTIGYPAIEYLRKAAKDKDAEVARRAAALVANLENSLDQLLADYRGYGLPLPPDDAKLVRFHTGVRSIVKNEEIPQYFLGFLLRPGTKDNPPLLLVGTQENSPGEVEVVEPKAELVKSIHFSFWGQSTFNMNFGLAVALQCHARGWKTLAEDLWAASLKQGAGHRNSYFYQPANLPSRTALAYLAWVYSANELVKPDTDRAKTFKRMKAVLAAEPRLNNEANRGFLKSVENALVPSAATPGSVERMIDDLVDMCNTNRDYDEKDPRYSRLANMGFAAVPALLEHLDDDRITRSVQRGFNNFPTIHLRVSAVVSNLLQALAGDALGKDWLRRQQGWGVEKADAQAWWDKAQKVGEEEYMRLHVLPTNEESGWPNSVMLEIIAKKYPHHLPGMYKTILDERPKIQSWPMAEAVTKSSLPDEKKRELFLYASSNKDLEHRRVGLSELQALDPQQFMTILLATLQSMPKTPTQPYWKCPEANFVHLVMATDDTRAWELLEKVAKRSDAGLRMEMLNAMVYADGDRRRTQRLNLLAAFLDDAEAPDVKANPKMFEGPHAGFRVARLEVRDFAAMTIASMLGMPDQPNKNWTPEQWQKLRNQVKERLKK